MKKMSRLPAVAVVVFFLLIALSGVSFAAEDEHFQASIDASSGNITIAVPNSGVGQGSSGYDTVINGYKTLAQGFTGLCAITAIIFLFINISKFGASGSNERDRQMAIKGILVSGIALSLFGGMTAVVSVFWTALVPGA